MKKKYMLVIISIILSNCVFAQSECGKTVSCFSGHADDTDHWSDSFKFVPFSSEKEKNSPKERAQNFGNYQSVSQCVLQIMKDRELTGNEMFELVKEECERTLGEVKNTE